MQFIDGIKIRNKESSLIVDDIPIKGSKEEKKDEVMDKAKCKRFVK